jgi:hypothetical protein
MSVARPLRTLLTCFEVVEFEILCINAINFKPTWHGSFESFDLQAHWYQFGMKCLT